MVATKREKFLSVPAAAKELGVSPKTMQGILDDGAVEFITPRVHRRVSLNSLKLYKASRTNRKAVVATVTDDPLRD